MHFSILNLVSALAIGIIISQMARLKDVRHKATIYALPFPITIALIATHGLVGTSSVIGISLVCVFIWLTQQLHERFGLHIILADVIAALFYVGVGYMAVQFVDLPFFVVVAIYLVLWIGIIRWFQSHPATEKPPQPASLSPLTKGVGTIIISFIMFTLKDILAGIVVTFPFSGVFAVVETKGHLEVFLRVVVRNTLPIVALFVTMYLLQDQLALGFNLVAGWIIFLVSLRIVQRVKV